MTALARLEAAINVWREHALEPAERDAIADATDALDKLHAEQEAETAERIAVADPGADTCR